MTDTTGPGIAEFIEARQQEWEFRAGIYVPHPAHPELHRHIAQGADGWEWYEYTHAGGMLPHAHDTEGGLPPGRGFQIPVPDESTLWLAASPAAWSALYREGNAARADIALYRRLCAEYDRTKHGADMMRRDALEAVLRHRAAVWDSHPDYSPAWTDTP